MRKNFLLALQLFVVGILVVWSTILGIGQDFYLSVWWWDIPSHVLGGMWAGLFFAWAALYRKRRISIIGCVLFALCVGAAWEVFEYVNDIGSTSFMSYPVDTVKDFIDDSIGGAVAGYIARKRL